MKRQLLVPVLACALFASGLPALSQSVTGAPVNLTSGSIAWDTCPRLSQNASRISYAAQTGQWDASWTYDNTFVSNLDGSSKTKLEIQAYFGGMDRWCSLNADGTKFAIQHTTDYTTEPSSLFVGTADPFSKTQITLTEGAYDAYPTWKSDSTKIAFLSRRLNGASGTYQLMMMKPEPESATNVPVQLTNWTSEEVLTPCGTPDGKILFVKKSGPDQLDIYRCDFADSNGDGEADNMTQITSLGQFILPTSPSQPVAGGKIYFAAKGNDGKSHVFSVNADGSGLHQVTGGNFDEVEPSAAGNKLAVSIADPKNGVNNYDVMIYTLNTAAGNGVVKGQLTSSSGLPLAGASVAAYDGNTGAGSTTTDASGNYTLTLPAGGYTLVFGTNMPDVYEVKRSVAVFVDGTTTEDAFTTPVASPRPRGTIATIKNGKVEVKWAAAAGSEGYNVYRATSEAGPYTKINAALVPATDPVKYLDSPSGNLGSLFYKVSSVIAGVESAFSEISQAANNLFWNPSFEKVDLNGEPIGWTYGTWGGDGTHGTSTAIKADGTRAIFLKTGANERGAGMYHLDLPFYPPTQPGVAFVEGIWGKFTDTFSSWPIALMQAPWEAGYGYIPWWYPQDGVRGSGLSQWDTNGLVNWNGGDTPWTWLYNTDNVIEWETTEGTRFTVLWPNDGGSTLGSSTAYADDATYQMKRYTTTGWVMGRILDTKGNVPSGITVTCGGKSVVTTASDLFIVKDVPTGEQTLTIQAPGQPLYTTTIGNYGGFMMQDVYVVPAASALVISGNVKYPNGTPCPGADVRLVVCTTGDEEVANFTTTTDANGNFSLGSESVNVASSYESHLIAHKNGYVSNYIDKTFGTTGNSTGNDITLIAPDKIVEVPKGTAPTMDGVLNTAEWADAATFNIDISGTNPTPTVATKGYVKWDATNIYFAFKCDEPNPAGIAAPTTDHDGGMWGTPPYWNGDDLIELRIDEKNGAGRGKGYEWWQLLLNSISVVTDIEWRDKGPSIWGIGSNVVGLYTACSKGTTAWYQEVSIPFTDLLTTGGAGGSTPAVGTEWYMTIGRQRHQPDPVGEPMSAGRLMIHFVNTLSALPKGDLDGNRIVNDLDAVIALKIAGGLESLGSRKPQGDVVVDNVVDIKDAVQILRKANGLNVF